MSRRLGCVRRTLAGAALFVTLLAHPAVATDWGRAIVEGVMRRHPDPAALGSWNYPAAFYLYGQFLVFARTHEPRYLAYIRHWVDGQLDPEGRPAQPLDALDRIMPGLLLVRLADATGEARYRRAAETLRRALDTYPRTRDGGFWHSRKLGYRLWGLGHTIRTGGSLWGFWHTNRPEGRLWADGAFMTVPFLLAYGASFQDAKANRDEAARQLQVYAAHLQDPATGLLYHAYDETRRAPWLAPGTDHAQEFWCRAVGWYGLALVTGLDHLGDHPARPALLVVLECLAAALARYQDQDSGRWFQVMDKGSLRGNWTEASCSSMHATVLAHAARRRYLPSHYAKVAAHGYQGVIEQLSLNAEGEVELRDISAGTSVGSLDFYLARPRLTNDLHGLGAFLIMHEERLKAVP